MRQQVEEKKAKENELKRKKLQDDALYELKLKEELERESEIVKQEKLKEMKKKGMAVDNETPGIHIVNNGFQATTKHHHHHQ